mmetsp:Transcript_21232/g.65522  ORF Transcript_21232/g.65522 Transcript_21232/m.65522 type:complete len:264 (+) Transcript_21232:740-1531(+)
MEASRAAYWSWASESGRTVQSERWSALSSSTPRRVRTTVARLGMERREPTFFSTATSCRSRRVCVRKFGTSLRRLRRSWRGANASTTGRAKTASTNGVSAESSRQSTTKVSAPGTATCKSATESSSPNSASMATSEAPSTHRVAAANASSPAIHFRVGSSSSRSSNRLAVVSSARLGLVGSSTTTRASSSTWSARRRRRVSMDSFVAWSAARSAPGVACRARASAATASHGPLVVALAATMRRTTASTLSSSEKKDEASRFGA